jgi:hypothetical protein
LGISPTPLVLLLLSLKSNAAPFGMLLPKAIPILYLNLYLPRQVISSVFVFPLYIIPIAFTGVTIDLNFFDFSLENSKHKK